jgi:autotransporter-associated beta strand protein
MNAPLPSTFVRVALLALTTAALIFLGGRKIYAAAEADLLVAYDPSYTASVGGAANVQVLAANAVAGSNAINARCGTGAQVRITGYYQSAQTNYQLTSKGGFVSWMSSYDSHLSDVVDAGNARGADLVTFLCVSTSDGAAAVAQQPGRFSAFDPGQFWSTVVAHELAGHNYGCDHRGGRENPKTVMLHNYCGGGAQAYYSNPNIWLNGTRLLGEGSCLGTAVNGGDNSYLIGTTAQSVADRYSRVITAPNLGNVVRRWSFNQPAAIAPAGTTVADSVTGAAFATVQGNGATFSGTGLRIPGGASGSGAAYLSLPTGLISAYANVTVEIWATPLAFQSWGRLLDFNNGSSNYLTLSTATASSLSAQRFESKVGAATVTLDSALPTTAGVPHLFTLTFADNGAGGGRWTWYRDGDTVAWLDVAYPLASLPDVNNWLGRSAYAADSFANCEYAEVRISNVAMTRDEVLANYALGPNRQNSDNYLTADDPLGQTSFNAAGRWSDGLAPSAGKTYETSNFRLRTPADATSRTFAGQSLKLSGGSLTWKGTSSSTTTIADLTLSGGPEFIQAGSGTWTIAGNLNVATDNAIVRAANGPITLASNLTGNHSLLFVNNPVTLSGTNTAFTGKILVGDGRASTLSIDSEARLGPNPAALVTDQLTLNRGTIQISGTQAIDDANRGILFDTNGGFFNVASGGVLTLSCPLYTPDLGASVVAGALGKSGAGTLILSSTGSTFKGTLYVGSGSTSADDGIMRVVNNQVLANTHDPIYINNTASGSSRLQIDGTAGGITLPRVSVAGRNGSVPALQSLAGTNNVGGITLMAGGANHIIQSDAGLLNFTAGIYSGDTGDQTVTFQGNGDIAILNTLSELNATTVSLVKLGTGTLTLAGASTHDGSTTLGAGTLRLDGSLTTTGVMSTAAGTTFSGTGSSNAATTIAGSHTPGSVANSTGTQTFTGPLSYAASSRLNFALVANGIATGSSNKVAAQGLTVASGAAVNLVLNGPGSTVDFTDTFWNQPRVWPLLTTSSMSGQFALGAVSADSAGHAVAAYGSFLLQQNSSGVSVVFYPLSATPPGIPAGLSAVHSPGSVTLNWSAASFAVSYNVRRSTTSGGPYDLIASGVSSQSYTDNSVTDGTTYYYVVTGVNIYGESDESAQTSATPHAPATINKADNTLALNVSDSWAASLLPTAWDKVRWSGLTGLNVVSLGANLSLNGLVIASTGGSVTINAGNTLTLGSGGIDMSAATQNLTISSTLALGAGHQVWTVLTGRTLALNGTLSRAAGSTLLLDKSATGGALTSSTVANSGSTGIVGPWAMIKGPGSAANSVVTGHTYATKDAGGSLLPYAAATSQTLTTAWGGIASGGTGTANYDLNSAGLLGATGLNRNINTLRYTGSGARQPGNNAGDLLTLNGLMNAGSGAFTIGLNGANITNDYSFGILIGANNELVLAPMSADIVLYSFIKNGAGGAGSVTVVGNNAVVLAGANTFTGGLYLNSGSLQLAIDNAIGTGVLRIAGGELRASGATRTLTNSVVLNGSFTLGRGTTLSGPIALANDVVITSVNPDVQAFTTSTLGGAITGTRGLTFTDGVNPTGTLLLSGANSYAGGTTLNSGTLQLGNVTALGTPTGNLAVNGGTLNLNALSPTVGRLSGTGGVIANLASGTSTLTTNSPADSTFSGALQHGATGQLLALTKQGAGTLTLSGVNTYTGPTTVSAGRLNVTGSLATGTTVSVASGATLGGNGSILGALNLAAGAVHAPGNPAGAQTVGGPLTYAANSTLRWTLPANSDATDAASRIAAGVVNVTAGAGVDLVFNSSGSTVDFTDAFWSQPRSWPVLSASNKTGNFTLGAISNDSTGRALSDYGTLSLQQTASAVTLVFMPNSPADAWRVAHFGLAWPTLPEAADSADPDGDGVTNLFERAFDGDPLVAESNLLPATDPTAPILSIVYRRSKAATDLTFEVEENVNLSAAWSPALGSETVIEEHPTYQLILHVRPINSDPRLFLRVKVTQP